MAGGELFAGRKARRRQGSSLANQGDFGDILSRYTKEGLNQGEVYLIHCRVVKEDGVTKKGDTTKGCNHSPSLGVSYYHSSY